VKEFKNVTYSVLVCTGLVALIQAVPLALAFMYFGVPGAVFWGFVSFILACIPFVGVPVIWVPMAAVEALEGNYAAAAGIGAVGLLVFGIENLRPLLQKRIGQIHPLISVLGLIVGLPYFGVMGVFIGPVVLSYAILAVKMYREEYV
jgi:predicted PurR-regulated permease PerM